MKKLVSILLIAIICISFCSCGKKADDQINGEKETTKKESFTPGTYVNTSAFLDVSYQFNENGTYDKVSHSTENVMTMGRKGTYISKNNQVTLFDSDGVGEEVFTQKDQYYYRSNLVCCFEKDGEYGAKLSFNENGRTNQWFDAYYETISEGKWRVLILILNEDGTFTLKDCIRTQSGSHKEESVKEGSYVVEDYVMKLNYDGADHPFLIIDGNIYFDVIEKQA